MFFNFLIKGFEHVFPLGYDHLLFMIALFLYNSRIKTAILQCSVFTIAHSLTLALTANRLIIPNSQLIEIGIAISIFIAGLENILPRVNFSIRLLIIFLFGLMHGIGFAGALADIGIKNQDIISVLAGFNIGVELAQASLIVILYFILSKPFLDAPWYNTFIKKPVSLIIASCGLFWAITRSLG
jgi:hypothetical protein